MSKLNPEELWNELNEECFEEEEFQYNRYDDDNKGFVKNKKSYDKDKYDKWKD